MRPQVLLMALFSVNTACFAASDLDAGIEMYNKGQFGPSIVFLQRAVVGSPTNVNARYYLANAMLHVGRTNEAIDEYRACYRVAPTSEAGALSLKVIRRYGISTSASDSSSASVAAQPARPISTLAIPTLPVLKECELEKEKKKEKDCPDMGTVLNWHIADRAMFAGTAYTRRRLAQFDLDVARDCLKKSEQATESFVPQHKGFGESEEQHRSRRAQIRAQVDQALAPYKKAVENRAKILADENLLYETCVRASGRLPE